MSEVIVTDETFAKEVLEASEPVLVDFWAPWCGPCRVLGPIVEKLAGEFAGKIKVAKLNVDENPVTAQKYGVMSIPTMIIYKGGQVSEQIVGLQQESVLREKLAAFA